MSDTTTLLTISIPTYNRPEQLKRTLGYLLPQITNECFLRIIDNYSDIPVSSYAEPIIRQYSTVKYEIIRNKINVGADNNIMRCFEYCETEWLWILGDDDILVDDAIELILTDVQTYSEAVNINYYTSSPGHPFRDSLVISRGKKQHLNSMDSFGNLIFISTNIYNSKHINRKNDLSKGFHYTFSCAAHWFVCFNSLGKNDLTVLSNKEICRNGVDVEIAPSSHTMSNIVFAFGFASFVDLIMSKSEKRMLIDKISHFSSWVTIDWALRSLIVEYKKNVELDVAFTLRQLYIKLYKYFGLKNRAKFWLMYIILLISPEITYQLVRYIYMRRRNIDLNTFI